MIKNFVRSFASRQRWKNAPRMPPDTIVPAKVQPNAVPELTFDLAETVYQNVLTQPRSFLKLPVNELIKSKREVETKESSALIVQKTAEADKQLSLLRQKPEGLIPRVEMFLPIVNSYALDGQYDKVEAVVFNLKQDFGLEPNAECMSALALSYFNGGKRGTALKVLDKLPNWDSIAQTIYKAQISEALKSGDAIKAENLFLKVQQHCLPSPELTGMILMSYGKNGFVEKGLKLYQASIGAGMEANPVSHAAMIYLCTRRKESFPKALEFYGQMKLLKFPIHLRVHNYILQGCSKTADLNTAIEVWNTVTELAKTDSRYTPNEFTISSVLWSLASVETPENKLSKREFHYDMPIPELIKTAETIYRQGETLVQVNSHIANSYLAILANNLQVEAAEAFFNNEMIETKRRTEHSYELMFKMYDTLRDLPKTLALKAKMHEEGLIVPFEGWRAMIRTAALNYDIDLALKCLTEMTENGYKPSVEDLKVVKLRICELRKFDYKPKLEALCLQEPPVPKSEYTAWRQRSHALHKFFQQIYGNNAPKLATDSDK